MNFHKYRKIALVFALGLLLLGCDDDENGNVIEQASCEDGIQNGDEEGVDCGGSCIPCLESLDFSGNWVQEDIAGRPAVNMFFGGTDSDRNMFNISEVSNRADFQPIFEAALEDFHDLYGQALDLQLDYETNILDLDAQNFTSLLAEFDALQVAPNGETSYFDENSGALLSGRRPADDVIDFTLTLMFGGANGTRFDGNNDTPLLISDGVDAGDRDFAIPFPYLESPLEE